MSERTPELAAVGSDPVSWVDRYGDYLFQYALIRLQDREAARDLVQETFLAALDARERFEGRASERTWLVGILKHKLVDSIRKRSRESSRGDLENVSDPTEELFDERGKWKVEPSPWRDDPGSAMEKKEFWKVFIECMAGLPGRLARVFTMRELEGLKTDEICNLTGMTTTNLGVTLYRARMRLRRCLEIHWPG